MGHMQKVQTQIRHYNVASDHDLDCLLTKYYIKIQVKVKKIQPNIR